MTSSTPGDSPTGPNPLRWNPIGSELGSQKDGDGEHSEENGDGSVVYLLEIYCPIPGSCLLSAERAQFHRIGYIINAQHRVHRDRYD